MKKYNTGIYQIVNQINDKRYIGSALHLNERKSQHFTGLLKNKHHNRTLQRAYNKYGEQNFKFEVLLFCNKENLIFYEQRAIDSYNFRKDLYNLSPTAENSLGVKLTQKAKDKISFWNKGEKNFWYGKTGELSSAWGKPGTMLGKKHKLKSIKKIKKALKNKIFTEEHRKNLSIAGEGKHLGAKSPRSRAVFQIDPVMNKVIKEWPSMKDAQRELNILHSGICRCCQNKHNIAGGFKWEYVNPQINDDTKDYHD